MKLNNIESIPNLPKATMWILTIPAVRLSLVRSILVTANASKFLLKLAS